LQRIALRRSLATGAVKISSDRAARIPPQHLPRQRAGVGGVLHHRHVVDNDAGARPRGELVRVRISRAVAEVGRIEDR